MTIVVLIISFIITNFIITCGYLEYFFALIIVFLKFQFFVRLHLRL